MLKTINVKLVHSVISLSRALSAQHRAVQGEVGADSAGSGFLATIQKLNSDPVYSQLERGLSSLIDSLSVEQKTELLALMYSGRGDDTFKNLLPGVASNKSLIEHASSQMTDKAPLDRYLNCGLEELGLPGLSNQFE